MKKTITMLTAAVMLFGSMPAASAVEADYERLIPDIKNRMEIPKEYSDFKCLGISEAEDGINYSFEWVVPGDDQYEYISIDCDADGIITFYNRRYDAEEYDFLKTDTAAAREQAERFAVKMNPELDGRLRLEVGENNWGAVSFIVYEVYNGIEYDSAIGNISVASDGIIKSAYLNAPDFSDEDVTKLITPEQAYSAYMENASPDLVYCTYKDEDENIKTFPAYINASRKAVSAVTGELIVRSSEYAAYDFERGLSTAEAAGANTAYKELNESEMKETTRLRGYISSTEAVKRVSDFLGKDIKTNSVYLNVGKKSGEYSIYSEDEDLFINADVDASNGDIISLYCYDYDNGTKLKECDFGDPESAGRLIHQAAPHNAEKLEYDPYTADEYGVMPVEKTEGADEIKASHFSYKVNGIRVMNAGASIESSEDRSGAHYSIYIPRLDELSAAAYDTPESFIAPEEALKQEDFKLRYIMTEGGARAAYITSDFQINAITGKRVNYRNEEINNDKNKYEYSDIENHWVKQTAEQLALAGIGFEGGVLKPDEMITAEEAYTLLEKRYYGFSRVFEDTKELLSRNQTAEIIVECMGLTELAEADIFKPPYADTTENFGAAAILKGYGIIAGDTDTFRPDDKITRAEFLQILYNTLISKH